MISTQLKSIIYSKKIRTALKNKANFVGEAGDKVGLILGVEDPESVIKFYDFYKDLEVPHECLEMVICNPDYEIPDEVNAGILHSKEISFSGEFTSEEILKFVEVKYDLLVCYFQGKNLHGSLLAAQIDSRLKMGNAPDEFGICDVEINSGNVQEFKDEVVKYYTILKQQ